MLLRIDKIREERIYQHRSERDCVSEAKYQSFEVYADLWTKEHLVELQHTERRGACHDISPIVVTSKRSTNIISRDLKLTRLSVHRCYSESMG
jgi:hypothetical protein